MNRLLHTVLALIMLGISWGCADTQEDNETAFLINLNYSPEIKDIGIEVWPEDELRREFSRYWHYKFAGDYDKVWDLEAPHIRYMGSKTAYQRFLSRGSGQILEKITIHGVDREHDNLYRVRAEMNLVRFGSTRSMNVADTWVKVQGKWYHVEKNPLVFPFSM